MHIVLSVWWSFSTMAFNGAPYVIQPPMVRLYHYGKVQKRSSVDTYVQTLDRPVAEAYKLFLSFSDVVTGQCKGIM